MQNFWERYRSDIRQTFFLSVPIVIGQLGTILMGLFDNAMVGAMESTEFDPSEPEKYGAIAVAAAGVSNAIFNLFAVLGSGIMMAVSTLVSISKAKRDTAACGGYLKYSLVASFLVTIIITAILLVVIANMQVFVKGEMIQQMGREYLLIITLGTFPMLAGLAVKNFTDGLSYTHKPAMVITLIGVAMNVFLNWLFIYGNWGFPAWELKGAAYATVISRIFIFVALLVYVYRSKLFETYRKMPKGINLASPQLKQIFKIGLPSGLQYFFEVGAFAAANIMTTWIGPYQSAAHQVALYLAAATYMVSIGLSSGGAIRVGAAYSEGDLPAIRRAGYSALILVILSMAVTASLFVIFNQTLPELFNKQTNVMAYASSLLLIAALFQFSMGHRQWLWAYCAALPMYDILLL
jgi:MATE family multidrug resistance protein